MGKRLVCICNMVTENEIHTALVKGAGSTTKIQKMTRAGTSCGRCLPWIDSIVAEFIDKLPDDPQLRIDFGE